MEIILDLSFTSKPEGMLGKGNLPEMTGGRNLKREDNSEREHIVFWVTPDTARTGR